MAHVPIGLRHRLGYMYNECTYQDRAYSKHTFQANISHSSLSPLRSSTEPALLANTCRQMPSCSMLGFMFQGMCYKSRPQGTWFNQNISMSRAYVLRGCFNLCMHPYHWATQAVNMLPPRNPTNDRELCSHDARISIATYNFLSAPHTEHPSIVHSHIGDTCVRI